MQVTDDAIKNCFAKAGFADTELRLTSDRSTFFCQHGRAVTLQRDTKVTDRIFYVTLNAAFARGRVATHTYYRISHACAPADYICT